ncbi:MAG: NACHT domain-containing protein, partial [Cyanobacteria bacterium J06635_10]
VGKPKCLLEFFRQEDIKQAFRKAFAHNNPSILLGEVEAFLDAYALGDEIKALQLDVMREVAAFATIFIEVTKRSRTSAEVLNSNQLISLHQSIVLILEQLDRLPTLEGIRTEMARLSAGEENKGGNFLPKSSTSIALAQEMRGWFETLGYRFEKYEVWQDDYFEWIINIPVRRNRYDRVFIRGMTGEVGIKDVQAIDSKVEEQKTDEGWLVTDRRISKAARDEVEKVENQHLDCFTFDELVASDADFSGYLDWLEAEVKRRGIDKNYVPLACTKEELDPVSKRTIGISRYQQEDGWIEGYIDRWLDDPAKEHISILGEFGTGKTWFALHYAWIALQRYRDAQNRGVQLPRLPLVIPLRDYAKAVSVESLFSEFFFRQYEIPIPGYSAFEQLNRMGKLLLIFDGFDEMAARINRQEMINNFWELAKVVVPGAKVILTCRTEHFPEAQEGRALLNAELKASIANLTGETPQFEVLELEKFDENQIRQVLSLQTEVATVERIMSNSQLLDLARRPVLTELILEALPDIAAGKPVDMSRVYLYAVRRKMERDIKAERTFTSLADKMYFLCELAWEMLSTDQMSLNYRLFPDRIRRLFGSAVEEEKDLDHWHYDMMGQTMLIRNADGDYTPAHRSLLEFFVAYKFAGELGVLADDFVEVVRGESDENKTIALEFSETESSSQQFSEDETIALGFSETESSSQQFSEDETIALGFSETESSAQQFSEDETIALGFSETESSSQQFSEDETIALGFSETESSSQQFSEDETIALGFSETESSSQQFSEDETIALGFSETESSAQQFSETKSSSQQFSEDESSSQQFSEDETIALGFSEDETIALQFYTWGEYFQRHRDTQGETIAIKELKSFKSESLERLRETFGSQALSKAVLDLLVGMVDKGSGVEKLLKIIEATKGKSEAEVRYVGGNAVTLTVKVDNTALEDKDLSTAVIKGADFSDASLSNVNFQKTNLVDCEFTKPFGLVVSLVFSPDDKLLLTGGGDGEICLWEVESGKQISSFRAHNDWISSVAFSPDGKIIASSSRSRVVKLWDSTTGECLRILRGHKDLAREISFNFNGTILASSSDDQTIKIWDVSTGQCINTLQGHTSQIWRVKIAPNNKIIVSGSFDSSVKIWDISTGTCLKTLDEHTGGILSITFSYDSQIVASGSQDKIIKLWDTNTGKCIKNLIDHSNTIRSLAFSQDNQTLFSGSTDSTMKVWSVNDGECLKTIKAHNSRVRKIALNSNGEILASCSDDQTIKLWDTSTGECLQTLQGCSNWVVSVKVSHDGQTIISGNNNQTIKYWDINTGHCFKTLRGHDRWVSEVTISPDGKIVASSGGDRVVKIWDYITGNHLKTLQRHLHPVSDVVFSSDGLTLASGSHDRTVKLWEIKTGKCLQTFQGHTYWVNSVVFNPDNKIIISGSGDGTIKLWDISSGKCLRTLEEHDAAVSSIVMSPDRISLASGSHDGTVKLWNIHTGECLKTLQEKGSHCGIKSVKFNSDGSLIAAGNLEQTIQIWDVRTSKCIKTLKGHTNRVVSVAFTPDDKFLVSGSYDETIKIWNIKTGKCVKTLSNKPYANMNITDATGLTPEQKSSLKTLGAVENY